MCLTSSQLLILSFSYPLAFHQSCNNPPKPPVLYRPGRTAGSPVQDTGRQGLAWGGGGGNYLFIFFFFQLHNRF